MPLPGNADDMDEHEHGEAEQGRFAVPGRESHESDQTLSPDERGTEGEPVPPPNEPKQPSPTRLAQRRGGKSGFWAHTLKKLKLRG
ncbi:MAG TPA: hypothetical protein VE753_03325 [Gaiellaceae bacterium]|nr:hypothetical protein [Gaiellaceae bacterium]